MMKRTLLFAFTALLLPAHADPGALWKIVNGACVPHVLAHQPAKPCAVVDLARRYALLKDREGREQFLLIPTDRISGIEDPAVLAPGAPNDWQSAWANRSAVIALAPRKIGDDDVGLAINPPWGRTQNQLHIHMDCVAGEVRDQLRGVKLGDGWSAITLGGVAFEARNFDMAQNPFVLLAAQAARQHSVMADWSMASVGAHILLATRKEPAEKLLDHNCN